MPTWSYVLARRCPRTWGVFIGVAIFVHLPGQAVRLTAQPVRPAVSVSRGPDGQLLYSTDAAGTRIPDFSHAGYGGGGVPLPTVPARIVVESSTGDAGDRIQAAIDLVSARTPDAHGFRGAVVLGAGRYLVAGQLRLEASGVVLRGSGPGPGGTTIVATGQSRRTLITATGAGSRVIDGASVAEILDPLVPAGRQAFRVAHPSAFAPGDRVIVTRPSTRAWIDTIGMNTFAGWRPENRLHWQPRSRDIEWDRTVVAVDGDRVTLDAPITTALDREYGPSTISRYTFVGRIRDVGIEDLAIESVGRSHRASDEDHAWGGVSIDKAEHVWVRNIRARGFAGTVVGLQAEARSVTVEDVDATDPVSEIGGYRRRVFTTDGQLTLFRRCSSRHGLHDFVVGFAAAGPNVFLQCTATDALDYSGPLESWSSGVLFDSVIIRGNALRYTNRDRLDQGQGWTTANSVIWNSEATDIEVQSPPGAVNQAYGCKGMVTGDGIVWDPRTMPYRDFYRGGPVQPASLYLAQLQERRGAAAMTATHARPHREPVAANVHRLTPRDVETWRRKRVEARQPAAPPLRKVQGRFLIGTQPAWTERVNWSWFQGQMPRTLAPAFGPALTRFAPGKVGTGWTDDLDTVAARIPPGGVFYQHYGLWYDRRRVDHNYYGSPEQRTPDVWAPFMEMPWARSGTGKAWDGLSQYDLTRFNPWYFDRIRGFADRADRQGLVLYHHFYFQHWLLESRSHYVDFPWRPTNTIQDTGLPDEVPAANVFYDISHPGRRALHQRYIRHALDNLATNTNVVHGLDREYTGSLSFVRFWLDTLASWQRERGRRLFVALEIPKDQLDTLLDDPVRGPMIAAIDVLGWVYRADGRLFAARGGINKAPREQRPDIASPEELTALRHQLAHAPLDQKDFMNGPEVQRLFDTLWAGSKPMKYRAWREYRDRVPQVVTLWTDDEYPALTAAVERVIPSRARQGMKPSDAASVEPATSAWCVRRADGSALVYATGGTAITLTWTGPATTVDLRWIGEGAEHAVPGGRVTVAGRLVLTPPAALAGKPVVAWLVPRTS